MAKADYYQTLGVTKGASADDIKKAFRKMAMEYHPDRNQGDKTAEAKFKEINEAYEILKDPQKKAAYDSYGHGAFENGGGGKQHGGFEFTGDFQDMSDIFGGIFGDMMGGRGRKPQQQPGKGSDLRYDLNITLEDAYNGIFPTIKFKTASSCEACDGKGTSNPNGIITCPNCKGSGRVRTQQGFFMMESTCSHCKGTGKVVIDPCKSCNGEGRSVKERSVTVEIPSGVEDGTKIRLSGKGESGVRGAQAGDLYVFIRISPHKFFERNGSDIHCKIPLKMTSAALGGAIEVPTISGKVVSINIASGTQHGAQIRVKGCGMKSHRSSASGDMVLSISVEIPIKLTKTQRELLEKFDSESNKDTHPQCSGFFDKVKSFWDDLRS